jgi:signal transduction histidine kinase
MAGPSNSLPNSLRYLHQHTSSSSAALDRRPPLRKCKIHRTMASSLLSTLREARSSVVASNAVEPGEAAVAKRLAREIDDAIRLLEGGEPEKDLVSIVCHDLKDPLASIVMGAGFLKKTLPADDGSVRRVLEAIARSADRMNQVVSDFHDLAKLDGGQLEVEAHPCDVLAVLEGALAPLAAQAKEREIAFVYEPPAEPVMALCERARLAQIVTKLVGNAIKFTQPGGRVTVRVGREGATVRVAVDDTGRGISPERLGEVFDHAANARRTPRDGPGLGLAIVRGLVELLGGAVGVESRVDEGSHFWFTLPASR